MLPVAIHPWKNLHPWNFYWTLKYIFAVFSLLSKSCRQKLLASSLLSCNIFILILMSTTQLSICFYDMFWTVYDKYNFFLNVCPTLSLSLANCNWKHRNFLKLNRNEAFNKYRTRRSQNTPKHNVTLTIWHIHMCTQNHIHIQLSKRTIKRNKSYLQEAIAKTNILCKTTKDSDFNTDHNFTVRQPVQCLQQGSSLFLLITLPNC